MSVPLNRAQHADREAPGLLAALGQGEKQGILLLRQGSERQMDRQKEEEVSRHLATMLTFFQTQFSFSEIKRLLLLSSFSFRVFPS